MFLFQCYICYYIYLLSTTVFAHMFCNFAILHVLFYFFFNVFAIIIFHVLFSLLNC